MRWMALVLAVGVFASHDTAHWLSAHSSRGAGEWFYMEQGAWTALLSGVLLVFFAAAVASIWRTIAMAALSISILEGLEMPLCMALVNPRNVPEGSSLCDAATGLPVSATTVCLEVFILAWLIGSYLRR